MGYLDGFLVTIKQHRLFGGKRITKNYSGGRVAKKNVARGLDPDAGGGDEKAPKPERLHGRHVLNRYEDGMEKCIGCELCAGVCPAKCIYVRGADNPPEDPRSPWAGSCSSPRCGWPTTRGGTSWSPPSSPWPSWPWAPCC